MCHMTDVNNHNRDCHNNHNVEVLEDTSFGVWVCVFFFTIFNCFWALGTTTSRAGVVSWLEPSFFHLLVIYFYCSTINLLVIVVYILYFFLHWLMNKIGLFWTSNIVRTWTEHFEHEHFVHVRVRHLLEPNLNVQVQVRAQDPRTRTEPNRGQSNTRTCEILYWLHSS
jgi:hypothetical protein